MLSVHDTQSLDPACHSVLQRDVDEKQPHFVLTTTTSASGKILKTAQRRPATTLRSCPRRFQLMGARCWAQEPSRQTEQSARGQRQVRRSTPAAAPDKRNCPMRHQEDKQAMPPIEENQGWNVT